MTTPDVVNIAGKFGGFSDYWSPRVIADVNDYQVKAAKLHGEFVWHAHDDTDELFLVTHGRLRIRFRDGDVFLGPGELCVVPRGTEHCPQADDECHVLLIEPRGVVNTGNAGGPLTAPSDIRA